MDLFDYLDLIDTLRDDHTQAEIGEKLGWSRGEVSNHVRILNVATEVLEKARGHQEGRVTPNATNVATHDFTEGWFRNSGIYNLTRDEGTTEYATPDEDEPKHAQVRVMEWFCP